MHAVAVNGRKKFYETIHRPQGFVRHDERGISKRMYFKKLATKRHCMLPLLKGNET
jgi:hypothetical protein